METKISTGGVHFYQSANLSNSEIKQHFVVRQHEYHRIISEIQRDNMSGSIQHYIITGRRGSGKSTLLRRIQAEVETDNNLNNRLIAINLSEEQAGVYRLFDLWEMIIREFKAKDIQIEEPKWEDYSDDLNEYSKALYAAIQQTLIKEGKKLILLLDNIDRIFDNLGDDSHFLREILINFKDMRIIGGSTRMNEHFWKYENPFYQFFRIVKLDKLSLDEVKELLNYWSKAMEMPHIKNFTEQNPGRISAIITLTDGMPRTLLNFVEMLLDQPGQNGFKYLRMIIDRATPIYQERLNSLPAAQRKIVVELASFWDAVKVKELIPVCKMTGKIISAQLNQLEKNHIVEKIRTGQKDNLYRLSERFYNLWLLMTQGGPKEKRKVKCLTVFLENWYNQQELQTLYNNHIGNMEKGSLKPDYAQLMGKALAHSKYISLEQRDKLIEKCLEVNEANSDYLNYLPKTSQILFNEAQEAISKQEYEKARQNIEEIEQYFPDKYSFIGATYNYENNHEKTEEYYLKAVENNETNSILILSDFYREKGETKKAEDYYLRAIEKNNIYAINDLGTLYLENGRIEEAKRYFLDAINKGDIFALNNLGHLYAEIGKIENAEKYYLKAIDKGNIEGLNSLGTLYLENRQIEKAEKYYLKAIAKGYNETLFNLGYLYTKTGENEKAEKYYKRSINIGFRKSIFNLAHLYYNQNRNRQESFNLIKDYIQEEKSLRTYLLYDLMSIWSGNIEEFNNNYKYTLSKLIGANDISLLSKYLKELLVHKQFNLIWEWFNDPKIGKYLKETLKPFYYITANQISDKTAKEEVLKAGNELQESIIEIDKYINERQKIYYG
jgi:TPR repeat protein